ncbi:MAG: TetR/AcrR family transcriptional regulator [Sandaracinaceae bacterium]|nr:TetR/AcrR family transcriptional regulator [Sandaracinaceae bacterium]
MTSTEPPRAEPRARWNVGERREQLLALGLRLFSERPYDEIAIDDIAREAGISKGLLYHYFGSKRDFYVECVREVARQLVERTEADPALPGPERAREGLARYLEFVEERDRAYLALLRSGIGSDLEVMQIVEATRAQIVARMLASMGLPEPRPVFRLAARSWIGQVEAASLDWLDHRDVGRDALVTLLLSALSGTLRAAKWLDPDAPFELEPI